MEILVTNIPPEINSDVDIPELQLFRAYVGDNNALPYFHQSLAFKQIRKGENVTLVAGTAAGKTLAVAVPLLIKLKSDRIKKVMFLYPTIALLEDQQQVIQRLATLVGLEKEIGSIQGGMSRISLIKNLNRKIILATPDAIYWFFRKNIKYSHILIYGLAQVDEFVLDEAHLFNGLVLQNLCIFFRRIFFLQEHFMRRKKSSLHILTATPQNELKNISNTPTINGKSRCSDVKVTILNCGRLEKADMIEKSIDKAIESGAQKILVISNSAITVHKLFLKQKKIKDKKNLFLDAKYYFQFGYIKQIEMETFLRRKGFSEHVLELFRKNTLKEKRMHLEDFNAVKVRVNNESLCNHLVEIINGLKAQIIQVFYWTFKKNEAFNKGLPKETLFSSLYNRNPVLLNLFKYVCPNVPTECNYDELTKILGWGLEQFVNNLEEEIACIHIRTLTYPGLAELDLRLSKIDRQLREAIITRFIKFFSFSLNDIITKKGPLPVNKEYPLFLKFLDGYFLENVEEVRNALIKEIKENHEFITSIKMHHVSTWKDSFYPVIVYSGSMSRRSREGLINLYDDLEKAVLLSTSAVEVGVDFAADVLITEECIAESFLQRFGRVGRTGRKAQVELLVEGDLYSRITEKIRGRETLIREDFSLLVKESFPSAIYLNYSDFIEASQYLVTEQLGMVGKIINEKEGYSQNIIDLAAEIRNAGINPAYGLRSTLPQISLQEETITRDPFYLLQYIENGD